MHTFNHIKIEILEFPLAAQVSDDDFGWSLMMIDDFQASFL